jgi:hypothetical protein
MNFPPTNKLNDGLPEVIESSAELLQEHLKKVDYKFLSKAYLYVLGLLLITLFSVIATVRLANYLF